MTKKTEKKEATEEILSFKHDGKLVPLSEASAFYRPMKEFLDAKRAGKPVEHEGEDVASAPSREPADYASLFHRAARSSGTHSLKMNNPRASAEQCVIRVRPVGSNERPGFTAITANAAEISYQKIIFRPLQLEGDSPRSLVDHILNPNEKSQIVTDAFASVFGENSLDAVRKGILDDPRPITVLPSAEFPVIFLPRPGGGDLQATPVSPASLFMEMKRDISAPFFQKAVPGAEAPRRGSWTRSVMTSKMQNVSGAIGGARQRMKASMPLMLSRSNAEIWRYAQGGKFPSYDAIDLRSDFLKYADLVDQNETHSNEDIRDSMDRRADRLLEGAAGFVADVLVTIADEHPDAKITPPPSLGDIIASYRWEEDRDRVRRILRGNHFYRRESAFDGRNGGKARP